jgi:hypothetical protein
MISDLTKKLKPATKLGEGISRDPYIRLFSYAIYFLGVAASDHGISARH